MFCADADADKRAVNEISIANRYEDDSNFMFRRPSYAKRKHMPEEVGRHAE
jgi:hypothetical protein